MERKEKQAAIVITHFTLANLLIAAQLFGMRFVALMVISEQKRGSIRGPIPGGRVHSGASSRD